MKRTLLFVFAVVMLTCSFATSIPVKSPRILASEVMLPIGNTGQKISMLDLSIMKIRDVETFTGKKMSFVDRLAFKAAQRQLRKNINPDGTINNKRILKAARRSDGDSGFHLGGFALGFFIGLIGVLIAYLINDDNHSNRVKWAWIGWGIAVVLLILLLI